MARDRIINQGFSPYKPEWVIYDRMMRVELFRSEDFEAALRALDRIEEQEQQRYECSNGSCED